MEDNKKATTVDEQIEKLKSRGMTITDENKAKEVLLDVGYYRLGYYWFPFEKTYPRKENRSHEFKNGTCFEYALKLYYFDFDLRNIFLRYISRIEINFRTRVIYLVSNKYKDNPYWYLDEKVLRKKFIQSELLKDAISNAEKEPNIKLDLKHHNRKHAPAWKVMENMTFGVIISIYDNLSDGGLRHDISASYGIQSPNQFSSYINAVRRLRNYCAHGNVIFDVCLPEAISNGPSGDLGSRKSQLYGAYQVFKYLLGQVSTNRVVDMKQDVLNAFSRVKIKEVKNVIVSCSGLRIEDI